MEAVNTIYRQVTTEVGNLTQWLVSFSLSSIPDLVALLIYMVLLPILVFFFLKDRRVLLASMSRLLPTQRPLMQAIWNEVNQQCANYVRGKAVENKAFRLRARIRVHSLLHQDCPLISRVLCMQSQ